MIIDPDIFVSPAVFSEMVRSAFIDDQGRILPPHARHGKPKNAKKKRQKAQRDARRKSR